VLTIPGLEVGGRLVGAVVVTHDSRKGWINRLAVDPAYRRQGYGTRLIEASEVWLEEQRMLVTAALVMSGNAASLALFQKAGYAEVDSGIHYLTKREGKDG
jgi:N-acetylglutamate synthase